MTKITTDNGATYVTPGLTTTVGAIVVGRLVGNYIERTSRQKFRSYFYNVRNNSQISDNALLRTAISDAFTNSGLEKNGVKIIDVKPKSCPPVTRMDYFYETKNAKEALIGLPKANMELHEIIHKSLPKYVRDSFIGKYDNEMLRRVYEHGYNASYFPKAKVIGLNIDKMGITIFHEMGHAINHNQSKIWASVQKLKHYSLVAASLFGIAALLKRKKVEGEQPKNKFDKATTFIKDNVGKLTLLMFVPQVAEEYMASHRGNKLAKKVLPPEMLQKVKHMNKLSVISYILGAFSASLGVYFASKTRDAIAKPKKING